MSEGLRWFTAIPHIYSDEDKVIWYRDAGSLCYGFQQLGVHSRMVVLGQPAEKTDPPVVLGTPEQLADPNWWRAWKLDGVTFTSWGAPRFTKYVKAVKESGTRLVIRLDTDGMKSPRLDFCTALRNAYYDEKDRRGVLTPFYALSKMLLFYFVPSAFEEKAMEHYECADIIVVESSLAKARMERWFHQRSRHDLSKRLQVIVNPSNAEVIFQPAIPKKKKIMAVGRWNTSQKDAPMMMKALRLALPMHPDYEVLIAGSGEAFLRKLLDTWPVNLRERVTITGVIENKTLLEHYQDSQIFFASARFEGFPFAATEALCCGCTTVGGSELAAYSYISSLGCGTVTAKRSPEDFADALGAEIHLWESGLRDPAAISRKWIECASTKSAATQMLEFFGLKASKT